MGCADQLPIGFTRSFSAIFWTPSVNGCPTEVVAKLRYGARPRERGTGQRWLGWAQCQSRGPKVQRPDVASGKLPATALSSSSPGPQRHVGCDSHPGGRWPRGRGRRAPSLACRDRLDTPERQISAAEGGDGGGEVSLGATQQRRVPRAGEMGLDLDTDRATGETHASNTSSAVALAHVLGQSPYWQAVSSGV